MTRRWARWSLARQFLLASLAVLLANMALMGLWVGEQIKDSVLHDAAAVTGLYVDSIITPYLQPLADRPRLDAPEMAALDGLLVGTPLGKRVVAFKVWSPDGEVLYSTDRRLIGRRFSDDDELALAAAGELVADLSDLRDAENEYERQRWPRLVEVYVPVRESGNGRVIAVTEFYQLPDELERDIALARARSWAVVAGLTLATYLLLAGIVKRGSDTIARQQAALADQVAELSGLLAQNARLHERVRQAARRTTALNEQALRRIGADLHDGPGQALGLALLRLDDLPDRLTARPGEGGAPDGNGAVAEELTIIHGAVRDALEELRAISAGLRLPELEALAIAEVVERVVRDHERRSGTPVELCLQEPPAAAPLAVKIALFRSLQEALSNATRHGGGAGVTVRVWQDDGRLCLAVSDCGPGFAPVPAGTAVATGADGHLGLVGMRERAQLLGGSFRLDSAVGRGATVEVCWPLGEPTRPRRGGEAGP